MNTFHLVGAIAVTLALAAVPARAQEGQGNPFPNATPGTTTFVQTQFADVSSEAYPSIVGRAGSDIAVVADVSVGSLAGEAPVQTVNSLPPGFEEGTVAFAYEQSVNQHFAARADQNHDAYATAALAARPPG